MKMKFEKNLKNAVASIALATTLSNASAADFWAKASIDYDTRDNMRLNVRAGASNLPLGLRIFSFADFDTPQEEFDNLKPPYLESRIFKKTEKGFGAALEYNRDFNNEDNIFRVGPIWEIPFPQKYKASFGIKLYPLTTHEKGMQIGIYGRKSWKNDDIYLEGYLDYNFKPKKVVAELQIGKRIRGDLYGIAELRFNDFPERNKLGLGLGLEWKL